MGCQQRAIRLLFQTYPSGIVTATRDNGPWWPDRAFAPPPPTKAAPRISVTGGKTKNACVPSPSSANHAPMMTVLFQLCLPQGLAEYLAPSQRMAACKLK